MFIIDQGTPGLVNVRNYGFYGESDDNHAHLRLTDVRVPASQMLGEPGQAFAIAQTRLGGGRLHPAMRTLAQATRAFELTCELGVSRTNKGERLADTLLELGSVSGRDRVCRDGSIWWV